MARGAPPRIVGRMGGRGLRRALLASCVALVGGVGLLAAPADAVSRLLVVGLPIDEAQQFAEAHPGRLGLGVFPDSRDALQFVRELSLGSPASDEPASDAGRPGALGRALSAAGLRIGIASSGPTAIASALSSAFSPDPAYPATTDLTGALSADVTVAALATADEADALLRVASRTTIVLGVGEKTPVWIEICGGPRCTGSAAGGLAPGVLNSGIARRPGIVTPYDLSVTILDLTRARGPEGFAGSVLGVDASAGASSVERVRALATRLERDAGVGAVIGATPVSFAVVGLAVSLLLLAAGRRGVAARVAHGTALVFPGFPISLFVPTGRGELRALAIAGVFAAGASLPPRTSVRTIARIALGAVAAFAALAAVAPLRPGGEPALSIWGNPLESWRFFGLQNVEASLIAAGAVVWALLAGLRVRTIVVLAGGAAVVIGAPWIGANFVGVLTFGFGVTLTLLALRRRRVEPWHVAAAAGVALVAFLGALLADAGTPVSHGGRAVRRVSDGGFDALVDLVARRVELNASLIGDFFGGWFVVAALAGGLVALMIWGARVTVPPARARAAVWGCGAMALASLVAEDSGFYSGATLWFTAASAWLLTLLHGSGDEAAAIRPSASGAPPGGDG